MVNRTKIPSFTNDVNFPTAPFTILEPENLEIGKFCLVQERRATDCEALKLCCCCFPS